MDREALPDGSGDERAMGLVGCALRSSRVLVVCGVVLLVCSCASVMHEKPLIHVSSPCTPWEIWHYYDRILGRARSGETVYQDEYAAAVTFFEETTGIPSQDREHQLGSLSSRQLSEDIWKWSDWRSRNHRHLVFDSYTGRLIVDEDARVFLERTDRHPPRYGSKRGAGVLSYRPENSPEEEILVSELLLDGQQVATVQRQGDELKLTFDWEDPEHLTLNVDDLEDLLGEMRARLLD